MPRSIWSGSVSFGLVNVPVRLMSATVDKAIHFHQVDEKSGARIRHKRVSERTGREVSRPAVFITLERLEEKNLVSSHYGDPTPVRGGRAKRFFTPTRAGLRAVQQSLETVSAMTPRMPRLVRLPARLIASRMRSAWMLNSRSIS